MIVVTLALMQYVRFYIKVGRARGRFEVQVPAISGNDGCERYFRAHQNTAERLVVFCRQYLRADTSSIRSSRQ